MSTDPDMQGVLSIDRELGLVTMAHSILALAKVFDLVSVAVMDAVEHMRAINCKLAYFALSYAPTVLEQVHQEGKFNPDTKEIVMADKSAAIQILNKKKKAAEDAPALDMEVDANEAAVEETSQEDMSSAAEIESDEPLDAESKPVKAKAAPKKTATITKTKSVSTPTDEIAETAAAIENLTEAAALKELTTMLDGQAFDEFRMGGILAKIQTEGWFGEHPNFRSLVEAEFSIKYRTAMYWISIYKDLVESGVAWPKVKRLGWTKLKELAPIMTTDNVDDVLKAVSGMNTLQIAQYVIEFNKGDGTAPTELPADVTTLKTKSFKLFEGQKETVDLALEKAQKTGNTESDNAALEYICMEFLNGNSKAKPAAKAKTEETGDTIKMPKSAADFVPLFQALRESNESIEESLSEILEAINDVYKEAKIIVELEDED